MLPFKAIGGLIVLLVSPVAHGFPPETKQAAELWPTAKSFRSYEFSVTLRNFNCWNTMPWILNKVIFRVKHLSMLGSVIDKTGREINLIIIQRMEQMGEPALAHL